MAAARGERKLQLAEQWGADIVVDYSTPDWAEEAREAITPEDGNRLTERALSELAAGRVRPVIGQTVPLERAADAHAAIEARSVSGKTLLLT